MVQFARSAMNPNGSYQGDGLDPIEMANQQHALQLQQMNYGQQALAMQTQLARERLAAQNSQFGQSLTQQGHQFDVGQANHLAEVTGNQGVARYGIDADNSRNSADIAGRLAAIRAAKEPGPIENARFQDEQAIRKALFGQLGIGADGTAAAPQAAPQASPGSINLGGGFQLPGLGQSHVPMRPAAPVAAAPVAGPGGGAMDPKAQMLMNLLTIAHGGSPTDFNRQNELDKQLSLETEDKSHASIQARLKQMIEANDLAGAKAESARTGVPLPIPAIEDFMSEHATLTDPLKTMVTGLATQDTNTTGWDPTDQDTENVANEHRRLTTVLEHHGYDPATAKSEADRIVAQGIGSLGNSMNAGWIQKLRARLGVTAPQSVNNSALTSSNEVAGL